MKKYNTPEMCLLCGYLGARGVLLSRLGAREKIIEAGRRLFGFDADVPLVQMVNELSSLTKSGRKRRFLENAAKDKDWARSLFREGTKQAQTMERHLRKKTRPAEIERPEPLPPAHGISAPSSEAIKEFYRSWEWKQSRYEALRKHGVRCQCCGARREDGVRIVVDHIRPLRRHWNLRLAQTNLQILCDDCNMGKGSRDETDWRNLHADSP